MKIRLSALVGFIFGGTMLLWLAIAPQVSQHNFQVSPVPPGADWTS